MDNQDIYYNEMPFTAISDKYMMRNYEEKMIIIKSTIGFTHLFRLLKLEEDCVIGIMYTGREFETVKIPLMNIHCFYVSRYDYNNK
jgi:hypothetical protein